MKDVNMREIEFRVWIRSGFDEDVKPFMTEVESIDFGEYGHSLKTIEDDNEWSFEDVFIMQYTGLKDKKGKKIYEGDILQKFREDKYIVVYVPPSFRMVNKNRNRVLDDITVSLEVIGNVFEHSNLLEGD